MDISGLISSFQTGTYTVTRTPRGTTLRGRVSAGTTTTLTINASVSPATGKDLQRLPEGRRTVRTLRLFTTANLFTGDQGGSYEADRIVIIGSTFEVSHVERWIDPITGSYGYMCLVQDWAV